MATFSPAFGAPAPLLPSLLRAPIRTATTFLSPLPGMAIAAVTRRIASGAASLRATVSSPPTTPTLVAPSCPALGHLPVFKEVSGARRYLRGPRMFFKLRGRLPTGTVLFARLGGSLPEVNLDPGFFAREDTYPSLPVLTRALYLAAHDPRIAHLHIKLDGLQCGWGKILEVRRSLEYFCQSGKSVTVYMEGGREKEVFLTVGLTNCQVFVPPEGALSLRGFSASGSFVRGVLENIGVDAQVERIGVYKSAGDQLGRRDMSDAQRTVIESLLTMVQNMFVSTLVACKPGMTEEDVIALLDAGYQSMSDYVDAGIISGLKYESEVEDELLLRFKRNSADSDEDVLKKRNLSMIDIVKYNRRTSEKLLGLNGKKKIAVIRATGAITSGKNGQSPVFGSTQGSESFIQLIEKAAADDKVLAVVLRVDSPGGSALASDLMWHAVRKLKKSKPVIASMVDVAASGGYYISMVCPIVAESATLTGSIGVVTAKLSLGELYRRIGYTKTNISKGRYAELETDSRSFSGDEANYFKAGTERAYESFVGKAAQSRPGFEYDTMHEVAQGRVWSGQQAKERGLVDEIGGFARAVEMAKAAAGIEDEFVRIEEIRGPISPLARLGFGTSLLSVDNSSTITSMLTSGEPLALCELEATQGFGTSTGTQIGTASPLQRMITAAVIDAASRLPGGTALTSAVESMMRAM
jgi:protease IV